MARAIVHLDGDAFYAAVEQAADPRLRGKPMAVGGERRGVITSASYEARRFGIHAAMPTVMARKLCPKLIVISGDFERYEQFSRIMFSYAEDHTPLVEIQGLDEGYFDLTANHAKPPSEIAAIVQKAIRQSLKITVSEGLASNKLVSQIASKANKPAGFQVIPPGDELAFLHPLPNRWLPGVGPKLSERLNAAGMAEIRHVAAVPAELLELIAGGQARQLRLFAQGIDDRPVLPERAPQKSYSAQETFAADLTDERFAEASLRRMADELFAKVRADHRAIRTLTVTVKYNDHETSQVSESLREPTHLETDVYGRVGALMRRAWERRVSLRMVGLKLSNLYDARFSGELDLSGEGPNRERRERAILAVEDLRHRYGPSVVQRGHDFILRDGPRDAAVAVMTPVPRVAPVASVAPVVPGMPRIAIRVVAAKPARYIPLGCHSHYSFLDSTLSPDQIVECAVRHAMPAVAMADLGNLHGAGEFADAAKRAGIRPVFGAELETAQGPLYLYVRNRTGYANLCRLLSRGPGAATAGEEDTAVAARQRLPFPRAVVAEHADGLTAVGTDARWESVFGPRFYQAVTRPEQAGHPRGVLVPRTHYGPSEARSLFDMVQSIRTRTLLSAAHPEKRTGEYPFRSAAALPAWVHRHRELLRRTEEIAEACDFGFPYGPPQFPEFRPPDGSSPRLFLRRLVVEGIRRRYGKQAGGLRDQLEEELGIIAQVGYEALFLHTWTLLQDCRAAGIEWITRGSAADSLVCYGLGISNVCPIRFDLYFKRFLNPERMAMHKLPDIDIDFPHDRKDDVVNLVLGRFGADHSAVVGGFSTFQARSAFADAGKVLGLSEGQIRRFTDRFPWKGGTRLIEMLEQGIETRELPIQEEPYRTALLLAAKLDGRPRNPKMHPCGLVLTRQRVHELTPTFLSNKGWPTTHYDMDVTEAIGLVKMDILAQGGLAVLRDAKASIRNNHGVTVDLAELTPWEDPNVWELVASGGSRAVHHIESPAMLNLCRMTNVREIDGLIAIVSVIRPGAANENKKLAFTRRYQGMEPPAYPHPCLEPCLRSTFGLVVYEEHILQIAETYAGLSAGRADVLRRALVKQKPRIVEEIEPEFFAAAAARGHPVEKTQEVWQLITSFQGYAFNKAHSTAYGVEAYEAAWIKSRYPAEFLAGVLTHGKGFYSRLVYVLECHRLGVNILPPTVNQPGPGYVAGPDGIRVPVEAVAHLTETSRQRFLDERRRAPFRDLADVAQRVGLQAEELEALVQVGAFDEFGAGRVAQFWDVQRLARGQGGSGGSRREQGWLLPPPTLAELPMTPPSVAAGVPPAVEGGVSPPGIPGSWPVSRSISNRGLPLNREWGMANGESGKGGGSVAAGVSPLGVQVQTTRGRPHFPPGKMPGSTAGETPAATNSGVPPPGIPGPCSVSGSISTRPLPTDPLREPTRRQRLQAEWDLLGFTASAHPLELFDDIRWSSYCPLNRVGEFVGREVVVCGLVVEQRIHHQVTGEPMKFLTIADRTDIASTDLFADTYRSYGLATVRYPVLEVTAKVEPFENGRGWTLRALRAGKPRTIG